MTIDHTDQQHITVEKSSDTTININQITQPVATIPVATFGAIRPTRDTVQDTKTHETSERVRKPVTAGKATPTVVPCAEPIRGTLVAAMLQNIPDDKGLKIDDISSSRAIKTTWWDSFTNPGALLRTNEENFAKGLITLGVPETVAGSVIHDGFVDDYEGVITMAEIGKKAFSKVIPTKETQDALAPVIKEIEAKYKVGLTDDERLGLAKFDQGGLAMLGKMASNPDVTIESALDGAVNNPGVGVYDFVDQMRKGVTITAVPNAVLKGGKMN